MTDTDERFQWFARDFQQGVISEAEADPEGILREEVFTQHMMELLEEFRELDDATVCHYQKKGMKVNGYGISHDDQTLDLVVAQCEWRTPPPRIPRSAIQQAAKLARGFLHECLGGYHKKMEEASPAFDLASRIFALKDELTRVRVFIVTDGVAPGDPLPEEEVGDIAVSHHVWDMERVYRCMTSGGRREVITIDFEQFGGPIPCLHADDGKGIYTSYVAIVPGETLAAIYEKWGTRMLEKNVRSFLQARGKINQGIRNTVLSEPNMFLTYNNGISVTAEAVELRSPIDGGEAIVKARDFQIVNGGQTTASLFHAKRKDRADLSGIRVQMKLTIVHQAENMEMIVPQISRYANTQNKVSMADFAANDPFHREVEEFSRTVWAPDPAGGKQLTHWFYERARGQYLDDKSRAGTAARERAFEAINPRGQVFTKTDVAKFENTWGQLPHIVSRGAQKNFAEFSIALRERGGFKVDQAYFQDLVAKAVMFKQAEKVVGALKFGGYRANIVTYTLSLISHISGQRIGLEGVWDRQDISQALRAEIERLAPKIHEHITSPPGGQNVTEWCKKEECWTALLERGHELSPEVGRELVALGPGVGGTARSLRGIQGNDPEDVVNIEKVKAIPASMLLEMSNWAKATKNLEGWQRGILYSVGKLLQRGKEPSRKQAKQVLVAYGQGIRKGFKPKVGL